MEQGEFILCGIKLVFGALSAFCVILLASKKRTAPVILLSASIILAYAETVISLLRLLGIEILSELNLFGTPLVSVVLAVLTPLFLVLSLIFFIKENL